MRSIRLTAKLCQDALEWRGQLIKLLGNGESSYAAFGTTHQDIITSTLHCSLSIAHAPCVAYNDRKVTSCACDGDPNPGSQSQTRRFGKWPPVRTANQAHTIHCSCGTTTGPLPDQTSHLRSASHRAICRRTPSGSFPSLEASQSNTP